jgi:hypothetical protein
MFCIVCVLLFQGFRISGLSVVLCAVADSPVAMPDGIVIWRCCCDVAAETKRWVYDGCTEVADEMRQLAYGRCTEVSTGTKKHLDTKYEK